MIRPVILSGGGGTRLWPLSRSGNPKQFQRLIGDQSLLQATAMRCQGPGFHPPLISTGEEQRFFVIDQLEGAGIVPGAIMLEPVPRNTAPAIALAALWALARGEDDPLLVMPSDHLIRDLAAMHATVEAALPAALAGNLVTFGIQATQPRTSYGYIQAGEALDGAATVSRVARFVEKPDADLAQSFIDQGDYYWNSGMFLFRPSAFLEELRRHAPDIADQAGKAMDGSATDKLFVRPDLDAFSALRSISIDYAVMEHSDKVLVVPASFDWSDLGSWDSVHELMPADEAGNVMRGDVLALDVRDSLIRSDADVTVAAIGLDRCCASSPMTRCLSRLSTERRTSGWWWSNCAATTTRGPTSRRRFTGRGAPIKPWTGAIAFKPSGSS
jgi:mannose-1-phosphate guanylyltransferase/mannose-6-phosphate isomerase